jgi:hypothetical protein
MSATLLVAPSAIHSGADGCVLGVVIIGVGGGGGAAFRSVAAQPALNKTRTVNAMKKIPERFLITNLHLENHLKLFVVPPSDTAMNFFIFVPAGNRLAATRRIHRRADKRCDNLV